MFLISPISLPSSLPSILILLEAVVCLDDVRGGGIKGEIKGGIKGGMKSTKAFCQRTSEGAMGEMEATTQ